MPQVWRHALSEKQQLVDDLLKMVEDKILTEMVVSGMTYDTTSRERVLEEIEDIRLRAQSAFGDPVGEAREKARSAIRDWVDVVEDWTSRSEEP